MMLGEISPGRRRGTLDGESCSTEADLGCDGMAAFRIMGMSDDDEDDDREAEEEGGVRRIGGVGIGDRGDDDSWILLESVEVSDRRLRPFRLRVEGGEPTEGTFRNSLVVGKEKMLQFRMYVSENGVYASENSVYAVRKAWKTTAKIILFELHSNEVRRVTVQCERTGFRREEPEAVSSTNSKKWKLVGVGTLARNTQSMKRYDSRGTTRI
jgi:hypothetical protein